MSELTLTKDNFEEAVLKADKPVLVDFWAPWCMPCRMIAPLVEEIANEQADAAIVGKINVDEQGELAMQYRVSSIPTLIVFHQGKELRRMVGAQSKAAIEKLLVV